MLSRFEEFTRNIALAYKYIIKIKSFEMEEYGLKGSNVACLFFLGKNEAGLTAGELCEKCMEDKAAVSKSLALLKDKGYISKDDKKYKAKYFITPEGMDVFKEIAIAIHNAVEVGGGGLSDTERENFYNTLNKIVKNLAALIHESEDNNELYK